MSVNLFQKYGGFAVISKVVMAFYDRVLESDVIGEYFDGINMPRLIDHQTKFISSVMGGPASYTDEALRQAHAHLAIDREAFEEMARLLEATLRQADFDPGDIDHIIAEIRARASVVIAPAKG